MNNTHRYPDVDSEFSAYRAGIRFADSGTTMILDGAHADWCSARDRAKRAARALLDAGETGLSAYVGWSGTTRPAGFPRNGICLPASDRDTPRLVDAMNRDFSTPMNGAELKAAAIELNDGREHGSRNHLAGLAGVTPKTIERQQGADQVDPVLSRLVRMLLAQRRQPEQAS